MESGGGGAEVERTNSVNLRELLRNDVERTNSAILLDFLRVKQDDYCRNNIDGGGNVVNGLSNPIPARYTTPRTQLDNPNKGLSSLGEVLSLTKNTVSNNRSLLETFRDEPSGSGSGCGGGGGSMRDSKKNWRDIRKRLKLRAGSSILAPEVSVDRKSNRISLFELLQMNANQGGPESGTSRIYNAVENAEQEVVTEGAGESSGRGEEPVRMSLMALLAEADSGYILDSNEFEEAGKEDEGEEEAGTLMKYNACCVCMVRHKGAAFIPCGHTFCRFCSRELYVQRGNCPLCNSLILEILDIF